MRHAVRVLFVVFAALLSTGALARAPVTVTVADPFIELHSGAGRGYPVIEVVEEGDSVEVLQRRTSWYQVRTRRGVTGWTSRAQLLRTLTPGGVQFTDVEGGDDLTAHRFELGATLGDFGGAAQMGLAGAWRFTPELSLDLGAAQAIGRDADSLLADLTLAVHPFPGWRVSPWFGVGAGIVATQPKSTLVGASARQDQTLSTAAGAQYWLSRAFVARVEYRRYLLLTSRDENEEIDSWTAGLSVFF